jgi:very-short-patch-repair endonuclease/ribosomal protein L15
MIECQICKRQLGTLVGKHLKSHGVTSKQYQAMFPGHPVSAMKPWTDELRAKQKKSRTGRKQSEETKAKIGAGNKGKTRSKEEIDKWRESYAEFLEQNGGSPQKGSKRSPEFCDRMRQIALNRDEALVQQKVDQMLAARRGQKMTEEQKANYSEARLKFIEENPDKVIPKLFNTKPEQEFEQILKERNLSYIRNKRIGNRLFDFLIDDCVVELDGPYHRNPLMHGNKSMSLEEREHLLAEMQERDKQKTQLAIDAGYRVFRVDVTGHLPSNWYQLLCDQGWDLF